MTSEKIVRAATAILFRDDQFLLQLRDDIPTILYPGCWTFFGGHIEPNETPEAGVWRELKEEINYTPPWLKPFQVSQKEQVTRHVFYGPLTVSLHQLELNEGWDFGLWTVAEIQQGERYSAKANQVRPLGKPHQEILLNFIAQQKQGLIEISSSDRP